MSATLQDVARMAGVHASTVSRVLSGKASIRSETRDRIFAAIRQLDYHPNSNARSLAGGHTGVLALVLDMNRSDPSAAFSKATVSSAWKKKPIAAIVT